GAGVLVNSADDPVNCTFILPAVARRGRLTVAVSSGGASPALAQHVRDRIAAEVLTPRLSAAADALAAERDAVHAGGGSTEGLDWAGRLAELLGPESTADDGGSST
ncbi:MAG: putative precorrin-2 dehydrogenase, partial [Ilumatobacteraceae bacterium]|nr:putative precorrin-2 dehydrogenase [Ilumatobacteraceae bacterium]